MALALAVPIVAGLGVMAYVRLAPSDPAAWHISPVDLAQAAPEGRVQPLEGGATLWLGPDRGDPAVLLARLDALALATPRTIRLKGTPAEGRVTWITRSALWGFPDYTTAEATPRA